MAYGVNKNKILTHNMLLNLQGILVALVISFATLFANWFTVAASPSYIKTNNIDDSNSSDSAIGSFYHNNDNSLTLRNITNIYKFTGEVNVYNLSNLPVIKTCCNHRSK